MPNPSSAHGTYRRSLAPWCRPHRRLYNSTGLLLRSQTPAVDIASIARAMDIHVKNVVAGMVFDFAASIWCFSGDEVTYPLEYELSRPCVSVSSVDFLREEEGVMLHPEERLLLSDLLKQNEDLFEQGGGDQLGRYRRTDDYKVTPAQQNSDVSRKELLYLRAGVKQELIPVYHPEVNPKSENSRYIPVYHPEANPNIENSRIFEIVFRKNKIIVGDR
ncbi:unnamed protein product, partial [Iphiclides podalirius]